MRLRLAFVPAVCALGVMLGSADARQTAASCAPKLATVLASDKSGAIYRMGKPRSRDDAIVLWSCATGGHREMIGAYPQLRSVTVAGRFVAYADWACEDGIDGICETDIVVQRLDGTGYTTYTPASLPLDNEYAEVTVARVTSHHVLAWVSCTAYPNQLIARDCLNDGHKRALYVRSVPGALLDGGQPTLVATGKHIDPSYLRLDDIAVSWRQNARVRRHRIGP